MSMRKTGCGFASEKSRIVLAARSSARPIDLSVLASLKDHREHTAACPARPTVKHLSTAGFA
jgi:hypothetical protein